MQLPQVLRSGVRSVKLLHFWPLLLPLALFLPGLAAFPYPPLPGAYSDIAITHYPNALFLRKSILEWGQIPLWSPAILGGYPFAANPLSGLWYPPGWLALLLPLPLGFNLLALAHLTLGGMGMYALLRREGLAPEPSLLAGLVFAALPKLVAHYGAGHLTLLYSVAWTPWLLYSYSSLPLPAILLALIFLADVRWAAYAGLAFWGYGLLQSSRLGISRPQALAHLGLNTALAALLAAPLALPLLEYTRLSTRLHLGPQDVLSLSLSPAGLLGLAIPQLGGGYEHILYVGAGVFALSSLALLWDRVRRPAAFWIALAVLSLLYALGSHLPGLAWLARLPGFDLLRVPPRALFLSGLALAALAGHAAGHLIQGVEDRQRRPANLLLAGLAGFAWVLALGARALTGSFLPGFLWGAVLLSVSAILCGLRMSRRLSPQAWFAAFLVLCLLDLYLVGRSLIAFRPRQDVLAQASEAARFLTAQDGPFRTYSPSYSLPQQTAAAYGIELVDGVDPLQLQAIVDFMETATGVPSTGYSVTLPPFPNGDPAVDNAAYRPDPRRLGLLNVRYLLSEYDLPVAGLVLAARFGSTRLYQNEFWRPRAWLQSTADPGSPSITPLDLSAWTPNRIALDVLVPAGGPQTLVLSEVAYPAWQARVDGNPVPVETFAGLLRSIRLEPGPHQVVFLFRPVSLYWGIGLCLAGILLVLYSYSPFPPGGGKGLGDRGGSHIRRSPLP